MSKKILVVDDSISVRSHVSATLTGAAGGDFTVLEAADGREALACIEQHDDIALVICDVNMPNVDGLELLEAAHKRRAELPVLMLTTEGQVAMMERAKASGAKGWMVKPFKPGLLLAAAKKLTAASPASPAAVSAA